MLFQKTTEFLLEKYPDRKFSGFNDEDTKKLYNFLFSFYKENSEDMLFKKDQIREAIVEFFKEEGIVSVVFKGYEKVVIRVRPFDISANTSRVLEESKKYLLKEKQKILDGATRTDLIEIGDKTFKYLNDLIEKENPNLNKKEIVKMVVIETFQLSQKDVVVFFKGKIFIRLFKELKIKSQAAQKGREGRFNGLPPEELKAIEKVALENGFQEHLNRIMDSIYSVGLDFSTLTNETYEKNNLSYLQAGLKKYFKTKLAFDDFVIDGFVNFVLRENFDLIHQELGKRLLSFTMEKVGSAEKFFNYYSGEITVFNGAKYQLPKIEDTKGNWWQIPVIKVVAKQRLQNLKKRDKRLLAIKKDVRAGEEALVLLEKNKQDLTKIQAELKSVKEELDQLFPKLKDLRNRAMSKKKELSSKKSGDKSLEEEIKILSQEIQTGYTRENELLKLRETLEKNVNRKSHQVYELDVKKTSLESKEAEDREKLAQSDRAEAETKEKYELILSALASALTKKKVKI